MKLHSIVNRYIFSELVPPFVMNLVFFIFIFLMRQILEITNVIVNYQVSIIVFFLMLIYSMPYFLVYIIPMSVMMSVLLTFLRLSNDNEVIALKASGISVYRLLPPVLVFGSICAVITGGMAIYGMPWGKQSYKTMVLKMAESNFNVGLKERQFNDIFDGVMFYVNKVDLQNMSLIDIYIEDDRKEDVSSTVLAPRGYLFPGQDKYSFVLRLYNGEINQVSLKNRSSHIIHFDTYDIRLDLKEAITKAKNKRRDEKEMSVSELLAYLKATEFETDQVKLAKRNSVLLEFHKKFSIPFACISLAILAIPLGVQSLSTRKSAGLGVGLVAFLIYYLLLSAGLVSGEAGIIPPIMGMWLPNIIMGGIGIYLLVKTVNDQPIKIFLYLNQFVNKILKSLGFRIRQA